MALRIIVVGYIVRAPLGGMAWHYAQYVLGLYNLGHDVYFFEDSNDWPACYHPGINIFDSNPGEGLASARYTFGTLGLGDRWVYYDAHTSTWLGPLAGQAIEICRTADLLINVSAWANDLRPWLMDIPVRVFVDTDPAFTQIDHLTKAASRQNCQNHTSCWSFGENIGQRNCQIPDDGLRWKNKATTVQ